MLLLGSIGGPMVDAIVVLPHFPWEFPEFHKKGCGPSLASHLRFLVNMVNVSGMDVNEFLRESAQQQVIHSILDFLQSQLDLTILEPVGK
jgi:hypothetical protein